MKIKKGDKVIVIAGKNKGTEGVVLKAIPSEAKLLVEGVNALKKHVKATSAEEPGQIISKEYPIDVSNVALVDPKDGKATRVGYKVEKGEKVRVAKRSGTVI